MRRITAITIGVILGLYASEAFGQGCYSESYGGAEEYSVQAPAYDEYTIPGRRQVVTIPLNVEINTPERRIRVPRPQPQIVPSVQSFGYSTPQICIGGVCGVPSFGGFSGGYQFGGGFSGGFGGGGGGISMRQMGGFQGIDAPGARGIIIRRGLRGRINGVFSY